jgi:DNA segregation ATPase FtsK/SpoIIIE, S-DNA-T family
MPEARKVKVKICPDCEKQNLEHMRNCVHCRTTLSVDTIVEIPESLLQIDIRTESGNTPPEPSSFPDAPFNLQEDRLAHYLDETLVQLGKVRRDFVNETQVTTKQQKDALRQAEENEKLIALELQRGETISNNMFWGYILGGLFVGGIVGSAVEVDLAPLGIIVFCGSLVVGIYLGYRASVGNKKKTIARVNGLKESVKIVEEMAEKAIEQVASRYHPKVGEMAKALEHVVTNGLPITDSWDSPTWNQVEVGKCSLGALRLGQLKFPNSGLPSGSLPALVPFPFNRGLLYLTKTSNELAVQSMQSTLFRLLAAVPAGKLRFTFIDPIGLGQNVAPLMHLHDYDEGLVTSRAWTEPRHINEQLSELTEHMKTIIQMYLRSDYDTIDDYNEQAGEIAEPYRILTVFDFPANFDEDSARRLFSIAQNGPRCGVYVFITADQSVLQEWTTRLGHGFDFDTLVHHFAIVRCEEKTSFTYKTLDNVPLELEVMPRDSQLPQRIIASVGESVSNRERVQVPFERTAVPTDSRWQADSSSELSVALGPAGARKTQLLTVGKDTTTAHHVLIAGRTGSGKSTLLHAIITNLALKYSPLELQLYLVDFKEGVEFKPYAVHQLPHARVIAIESEREFGLSVLQGLDQELNRRGGLFRKAGVDSIDLYRRATGEKLPRVLLIVDEFQEFFVEDDALAQAADGILDRFVRQGRAFGLHVILASQSLAGIRTFSRSTIDQMGIRIALQSSEADSRLILAEDNGAARLLTRAGEAIYNNANGLVEGNKPFQVVYLGEEERTHYLEDIQELKEKSNFPLTPPIIFEGNAPAHLERNELLARLIDHGPDKRELRRVPLWLGEPLAIKEPTAAYVRWQTGSHLAIIGQNGEAAASMLVSSLVSLAAHYARSQACFYLLNYGSVDARETQRFLKTCYFMTDVHETQYGRRRETERFVQAVYAECVKRQEMESELLLKEPSIFLVIFGLQRARDLRSEDYVGYSRFGYDSDDAAQPPKLSLPEMFQNIMREGPELGIHVLVWIDRVSNLDRILDRRLQDEFEMRVALQMGAEDSTNWIDSPAASKVGHFRAFYYNDEDATLEKFRPYGLPDESWMENVKTRLLERNQA